MNVFKALSNFIHIILKKKEKKLVYACTKWDVSTFRNEVSYCDGLTVFGCQGTKYDDVDNENKWIPI